MSQNSSCTRYLLIQEIFCCLLIFVRFKKLAFHEDLLSQFRPNYLFRLHYVTPIKQKHWSDNPYNFNFNSNTYNSQNLPQFLRCWKIPDSKLNTWSFDLCLQEYIWNSNARILSCVTKAKMSQSCKNCGWKLSFVTIISTPQKFSLRMEQRFIKVVHKKKLNSLKEV